MTDITELAQSHELLIANGQQTADLLRHLADNEIDSDYFAVVSECESYGKETEAELSITEFALRAARYVDELVEALEKAQAATTQQGNIASALLDEVTQLRRHADEKAPELRALLIEADSELEVLRQRIAELESGARSLKEDYTLAVYKMLLATMEAEPVAYIPESQLSLLERAVMVDADLSKVQRFDEIPLYRHAQPAPVVPGWIPVSEQLPEDKPGCYEYLVFETLNNRVAHDYWNVPDDGEFTPFWNHYGEYVTHWMPLPAAPREVK